MAYKNFAALTEGGVHSSLPPSVWLLRHWLYWRRACVSMKAVREEQSQELLLCIAYVFEVLTTERGPRHQVYRLVGHWLRVWRHSSHHWRHQPRTLLPCIVRGQSIRSRRPVAVKPKICECHFRDFREVNKVPIQWCYQYSALTIKTCNWPITKPSEALILSFTLCVRTWQRCLRECSVKLNEELEKVAVTDITVRILTDRLYLANALHCVQKKTPTHIFFHISTNDVWI